MMTSPHQCLRKAETCARLTRYAETPQMRVALSNFERTWLRLAEQCRRVEELLESVERPAAAAPIDRPEFDAAHPKLHDDIAARLAGELAAEVDRLAGPGTRRNPIREVWKR
jgi:hypothetical protein